MNPPELDREEEKKANTRLIAQAPRLYALARTIASRYADTPIGKEAAEILREVDGE